MYCVLQTSTVDACRLASQEVGQSFAEYNLHFYRICTDEEQ